MFRIHESYPLKSTLQAQSLPLVTDLDDAWYELRSSELNAELEMEDYRLPLGGLAYVEFVRFGILPLAESLRDRAPTPQRVQSMAADLVRGDHIYLLTIGEHVRNIPILFFHLQEQGEEVQIFTRTFLEGGAGKIGILPGRDLADPALTMRAQIIGEARRFLEQHLAFYRSIFPVIENGATYQEWRDRVAAL